MGNYTARAVLTARTDPWSKTRIRGGEGGTGGGGGGGAEGGAG
jgi:hypothetical protein